jgi:hypothetical protein
MKILSRVLAGLLVSFIVTCATAMVETFTALQDLSQVRAFLFCSLEAASIGLYGEGNNVS